MVVPFFQRFLACFPDVFALAAAEEDEVLRLWSGLGYYTRARNLHRAARAIASEHEGRFPADRAALERLPGIGRSTAAAVAAFAYGERAAILDGNVKRVLARHFAVSGWPGDAAIERALWSLAESLLPARHIEIYTQALMDLGAMLCTSRAPRCGACPVRSTCCAYAQAKVDAYPAPRPRRTVPRRSTVMLVLVEAQEVLLEKRPVVGVWGSLWSFPQAESRDCALALASRFGEVEEIVSLTKIAHAFTHYALDIHPLLARMRGRRVFAGELQTAWVPLAEARDGAVPAPVRRILGSLLPKEAAMPTGDFVALESTREAPGSRREHRKQTDSKAPVPGDREARPRMQSRTVTTRKSHA